MTIPSYQETYIPILKHALSEKTFTTQSALYFICSYFKLSEEEKIQLTPNGTMPTIRSRTYWGIFYLRKAHLIKSTSRGKFILTERGKELLNNPPQILDDTYLLKYPEFVNFKQPNNQKNKLHVEHIDTHQQNETAEERILAAYNELSYALADEVLEAVKACTPAFLERLIVKLLVTMGYGGSVEEAGEVLGKSGDGGIDGVIKEDPLGLDTIYLQAKRYKEGSTIGRPEIQAFVGALAGHHAHKGIFITTSEFSKQALEYVKNIPQKVILIDGQKLARLMISHNIGVSIASTFHNKKIDNDFFDE
jgi:restriction system protein